MRLRQTTLGRSISLDGIGVHSNVRARLTLHPADADTGILFHRTDLSDGAECFIDAHWTNVVATELGTRLGAGQGSIGTVEHVMAALAGLGIDNAIVEVDGPEVPILDGSAEPIVAAIEKAGTVLLSRARKFVEVLAPVRVSAGQAFAELRPSSNGFSMDVSIDFADPAVGQQRRMLDLGTDTFRADLARARTFGFVADVERLWRAGFALGSSFDNTVAIADGRVMNEGGLRFADECVRHKMLDVVGDLALAGAPILGAWRSHRSGHTLNHAALRALFADRSAWRMVEPAEAAARSGVASISAVAP